MSINEKNTSPYRCYEEGVYCIDANYVKRGAACFYLLHRDGECAVIETGTRYSVDSLLELLVSLDIKLDQVRYVIPTHVHLDHAGGAGVMMSHFNNAELLIHPRGSAHMIDPGRLVAASKLVYGEDLFRQLYGDIEPVDASRVVEVKDGDTFVLGQSRLELRHTRGHADHHLCIWDDQTKGWFSGDMFGVSYDWFRRPQGNFVMPATTPTQFRLDEYLASLALLDSYKPKSIYLTHFGHLPYSQELYRQLREQLQAYPGLVEASADGAALQQAIVDLTHRCMQTLDPDVSREQAQEFFGMDAQLNAQGLLVWQQRQSQTKA